MPPKPKKPPQPPHSAPILHGYEIRGALITQSIANTPDEARRRYWRAIHESDRNGQPKRWRGAVPVELWECDGYYITQHYQQELPNTITDQETP